MSRPCSMTASPGCRVPSTLETGSATEWTTGCTAHSIPGNTASKTVKSNDELFHHTVNGDLTADAWDRWYYTPNSYPLLMDLIDKHIVALNPNQHDARGVYMHLPADLQVHSSRINPGVNRGYQPATLE